MKMHPSQPCPVIAFGDAWPSAGHLDELEEDDSGAESFYEEDGDNWDFNICFLALISMFCSLANYSIYSVMRGKPDRIANGKELQHLVSQSASQPVSQSARPPASFSCLATAAAWPILLPLMFKTMSDTFSHHVV